MVFFAPRFDVLIANHQQSCLIHLFPFHCQSHITANSIKSALYHMTPDIVNEILHYRFHLIRVKKSLKYHYSLKLDELVELFMHKLVNRLQSTMTMIITTTATSILKTATKLYRNRIQCLHYHHLHQANS